MSHSTTSSNNRVLILVCTFNEVDNLPILVDQLHQELPQADILVVDDCSPDGTGDWVNLAKKSDHQLFLLARSGKLGLGSATKEGIAWCLEHRYDYLIQMDADLSHRPQDVPRLLAACRENECAAAIGTRYAAGGGFNQTPFHRRMISRALNRYATWLLRLPVSDCSGSFRCYRVSHLRKLNPDRLTCSGYGFLEEILVYLHRAGGRFVEVPILFDPRTKGHSKLSLQDALGALSIIHRLAFAVDKK